MPKEEDRQWLVVGIGGATCSGKTSTSTLIQQKIPNTLAFNQDKYFLPPDSKDHTMIEELNHANWELTTSVDMKSLVNDVRMHLDQKPPSAPGVIIIEGIVILNYKPIVELCDLKYFITLPKDECYRRRKLRSYDPPDPPGYFEKCVWPMYEKHRKEVLEEVDNIQILDGTTELNDLFQVVYNGITTELQNYDSFKTK